LLTETGAIGDARREPGLGGFSAGGINVSESISASEHPDALLDAQEPDASTEIVIEIAFQGPMLGEDLLPLVHPLRTAGRKAVRIFAQDTEGQLHPAIDAGVSYDAVHLAVLLANRSGALSAIEWSQIWNRAQSLAEQLECSIEGPDQQKFLDLASRLDDMCAGLDTQVGLTLLMGANHPVSDVTNAAQNTRAAQLTRAPSGRWLT